ncbi:MAG: AIR synthase-related protein [Candidatus Micrarchaeota archaeon]
MDAELEDSKFKELGVKVLTDPVSHDISFDSPFENTWRFEISSQIDSQGRYASEAIRDAYGLDTKVNHYELYSLSANVVRAELDFLDVQRISKLFYDSQRQHCTILKPRENSEYAPIGSSKPKPDFQSFSMPALESRLVQLSNDFSLGLSANEMKAIKYHYKSAKIITARKRLGLDGDINEVELNAIAGLWSERCKHKLFNSRINYRENGELHSINSLFRTFIQGAGERTRKPYVISAFTDNAGIMKFNPDYDAVVKVEAQDVFSDPYHSSLECMLHTQRHVLGTGRGAKLIATTDVICSDAPLLRKGQDGKDKCNSLTAVVKGISDSSNKAGVPIVNGSVVLEDSFSMNPLLYCGAIGLIPCSANSKNSTEKQASHGNHLVMVGSRFADVASEKMVADFIVDARDNFLYSAITDSGQGGLSTNIADLALLSGGCDIDLGNCISLKDNLALPQVFVSECLGKMILAVKPEDLEKLKLLSEKHGVDLSVAGTFTENGYIRLFYGKQVVAYIDLKFLHEDLPQLELNAVWNKKSFLLPNIKETDPLAVLKLLLSSQNISSRERITETFNLDVGGRSVIRPRMFSPPDAAVIRPSYDSNEGLVIANGVCPKYVQDGHVLSSMAFDEAVRNAISAGAKFGYLAAIDNFSWPDSINSNVEGNYALGQLVRACIGLYDASTQYMVPIISGKDFAYVDKGSGMLNLLITIVGKIDDVRYALTPEFKKPGDFIYLLGETKGELGGSEYYRIFGGIGTETPKVDFDTNFKLYKSLSSAIEDKLLVSCHDVSDGGLAVALAEMSFPSGFGLDFDLSVLHSSMMNEDALLFSETPGRFVVCVSPENVDRFEQAMAGSKFAKAGRVRGDKRFVVRRNSETIINESLEELESTWRK